MGRLAEYLYYSIYAGLAIAVAVLLSAVIENAGVLEGILAGALFFLFSSFLHEAAQRRREQQRTTRRILLLKRAFDKSQRQIEALKLELRRASRNGSSDGDETLLQALQAMAEEEADLESDAARSPPSEAPGRSDAASPVNPHSAKAARATPAGAGSRETDDATAHEVRVLQGLIQQLFADGDIPVRSREERRQANEAADMPDDRNDSAEDATGHRNASDDFETHQFAAAHVSSETHPEATTQARQARPEPSDNLADNLDDDSVLEIVRSGLQHDRVHLYLQPIVSLPQRKRRYFECYSRIETEDGKEIGPDRYISVAKDAGLLTAVDNMLLFRCVQLVRAVRGQDSAAGYFCNIAPHTIADREFFRDFVQYMENHTELVPRIVLEFTQADFDSQMTELGEDMRRLGKLGYRFSLDGMRELEVDPDTLLDHHVKFVKVDASMIIERMRRGGVAETEVRAFKQHLDSKGIDLIVERIESEAELLELLDFNIDFGQGYLFGEPRRSRGAASAIAPIRSPKPPLDASAGSGQKTDHHDR